MKIIILCLDSVTLATDITVFKQTLVHLIFIIFADK